MKILSLAALMSATMLIAIAPATATMKKGAHKMEHKMSAKEMKKMESCKAMDHAMAMKDKHCAKMMEHDAMAPKDAMGHDAMAPTPK